MVNTVCMTWPQAQLPVWSDLWAAALCPDADDGQDTVWMARVAAGDETGL